MVKVTGGTCSRQLFSTCFVAVSTITVNPHYGLMLFTEEQEKSSESQAGA